MLCAACLTLSLSVVVWCMAGGQFSLLGATIVPVEQDAAFARRASQRFVIMEKGRIAAAGAINELTDELVHRHMAV